MQSVLNSKPRVFNVSSPLAAALASAARIGIVKGAYTQLDAFLDLVDSAVPVTRTARSDSLDSLSDLARTLREVSDPSGQLSGSRIREIVSQRWDKLRSARQSRLLERMRASEGKGEHNPIVPRPGGNTPDPTRVVGDDRVLESYFAYI